ncbi:MAG: DUF1559 domain-containing protein [Planctomycetota bacterium]|nr:DUF1559 domain-containing protein [Planctomycetota bacterium]
MIRIFNSIRKLFVGVAFATLLSAPTQLNAQTPAERYLSIPADSLSLTSIDVASLRNRKELEIVPWEIITAFGRQELGIDPLLISSVDISAGMPTLNGPEFGAVILTSEPVDIVNLNNKLFSLVTESPKVKGMRFRNLLNSNVAIKIVQLEPKKLLVGTDTTIRKMMSAKAKPNKMVDLASVSKYPISSVTALEWVRPIADGAFADFSSNVPPQLVDDIQIVIDELQYVVTGSDIFAYFGKMEIKVVAKDDDSAKKLAGALERLRKNGMVLGEKAILQALQSEKEISPEVKAATIQYLERLKEFLSQAELWSVSGNEIAIKGEFAYTVPTIGVLTGLLLPAVQAAREAARRMQSSNNTKQLLLSLLNYESAYKRFPPRASKGKDGKPLLSWRVAMLPYLEQNALYEQFHLDEPWDSDHNIKLLDKMPATFKHPDYAGPEGHTVYLAPFYEDTVWNLEKPRFANITDGTSNTIALFEVDDSHAVPWTKPEDLDLREMDLTECFRGVGSNAGFFDGSVRYFPRSMNPVVLKAIVTSAGGEVVQVP